MRNGAIASLLVVALIMGVAFGTVFFPRTLTKTVTLTQTVITSVFLRSSSTMATNSVSITSVGSETFVGWNIILACSACDNTTTGATFDYPLGVNYGGPWLLHYWVQNYSGTRNTINGNLIGSGNSEIWITFGLAGYAQYTLCASATKVPNDSPQQFNLPLTLSLFNQNESTTASNPTVEVCGSMAV